MTVKRKAPPKFETKRESELDLVFGALSDSTRRKIVRRLAAGPAIVTELAEPFSMSLAAVSKHLRVLQNAGLIEQDKQGRKIQCALNPAPLADAEVWLEKARSFWNEKLDALDEYLRETTKEIERK